MESLFAMSEPPLGMRVMTNPTWPQLTDDARIEKLRTLLFHDLHDPEGGDHQSQTHRHISNNHHNDHHGVVTHQYEAPQPATDSGERVSVNNSNTPCTTPSRYESQKRRDWNTFRLYLKNHQLELHQCSGTHVLEFLTYLDQFGKTKVHLQSCTYYGVPHPPHPCRCPLRQAWGSLDALIGRLRAAFEENGGMPESNPFGARLVRLFLREVREMQAKARGVAYGRKKRKYSPPANDAGTSTGHGGTATSTPTSSSADQQQEQRPPLLPQRMQQQQQQQQAHDQAQSENSAFSLLDYTPTPDPHPLNAYSPNSNPLIKPAAISSFRQPMRVYSFLDNLPGRTPASAGWNCGTLYSR